MEVGESTVGCAPHTVIQGEAIMLRKKLVSAGIVSVVLCSLVLSGCHSERKARLLVELPDYCNTPDGMALMPDGGFVLSIPNFNDPTPGAFIMKVSAGNKVSKFFVPPVHPETGKAGPMGICLRRRAICTTRTTNSVPKRLGLRA